MSKMGSRDPFGHLQHKLWQKERPRVKLVVWLSTTKSRESTRLLCVQMECDTLLESSRQELQLYFRPHPDCRFEQEVMVLQSYGSPTLAIRDSPLGIPGQKGHLDMGFADTRREYYMGEGGGFLWVHAVVNLMSPKSPVACPSTKGAIT
jgi:hypothetical protein